MSSPFDPKDIEELLKVHGPAMTEGRTGLDLATEFRNNLMCWLRLYGVDDTGYLLDNAMLGIAMFLIDTVGLEGVVKAFGKVADAARADIALRDAPAASEVRQ